jgi:nucleoside-diphosphate-sugar epimerase
MRIGLTGGTGLVGRQVIARLARSGHRIRAWHRPRSDLAGITRREVEWIQGDLGDAGSMRRLVEDCDAVVHAALDRTGGRGFRDAAADLIPFLERNLLATIRLIEAARAAGVQKFIFISTCAVHEVILDDRPLDEAHPPWPLTHYGAHKAAIEAFVSSYGRGEGYAICALRPTGIYGLTRPVERSKWYDLVRKVARGEAARVQGGGKEVHAADVARAVEILLEAEKIAGECYNCYDMYISQYDVALMAKRIAGSDSVIEGGPSAPKHQIETGKLRALGMEFGGMPLLEQTIAAMVREILDR